MDKQAHKIINDLLIQLGTAIGFLRALYFNINDNEHLEDSLNTMANLLDNNASRIVEELNNE